ncbi:MAG: hypothetical protein LBO64_01490, partial [Desulfovibrio sp.]|nr:hypothetical protein [Desulfovibrio sp.]
MSLFIRDGKIKNTVLLNGFLLSMFFAAVYILAFIASGPILEKTVPQSSSSALLVWMPPAIISLTASLICALPLFFVSRNENFIAAFILIAVYAVFMILFLLLKYDAESRMFILKPLVFYFALPAASGN